MKQLFLIVAFAINICAHSQDNKTITLIVSGQGKTQNEAEKNALRSAIEQSYGTFISSNTEILDNQIIKDEIISVANGNIQKFEILSNENLPNGFTNTLLKVTVSINKLTTFAESKGVKCEFQGNLFAANIQLQEVYEKNEIIAFQNLSNTLNVIADKSFNYSISINEPLQNQNFWDIPIAVKIYTNDYFSNFLNLLFETSSSLSLSPQEKENYHKLNKKFYPFTLLMKDSAHIFYLRNKKSVEILKSIIFNLDQTILNFEINNNIENFTLSADLSNLKLTDSNFKIILGFVSNKIGLRPLGIFETNSLFLESWHEGQPKPKYNIENDFTKSPRYEEELFNFLSRVSSSQKKQGAKKSNFSQLESIVYNPYGHNKNLGFTISFNEINKNEPIVQIDFSKTYSLDEIKKLDTFEITHN